MPPPRDVQVVQPEGVPRLEATAMDPVANEAMAAGPSRHRRHRRTRDTAPPAQVVQVPAPMDVEVVCRDPPPSPSLILTFTCVYERLASLTGGVHDDG